MNISVPVSRVIANVTFKFGNSQKKYKEHKNKVQNDYIEQKSNEENIGRVGKM